MNVLVTGAAGYIGSHAVRALLRAGHTVVAVDNLSRGHARAIPKSVAFEKLDVRQSQRIEAALLKHRIDAVMHFAAFAYVEESSRKPLEYYDNNTGGTNSLLQAMIRSGVQRIVFSSTCATYGQPDQMPIVEETPQRPINPYGASKLFSERALQDLAATTPEFGFAALRYFNVVGCAEDGSLGEHHEPETHLIPLLLQTALGQRESIVIFGDDYATADGTCVRDYVHVEDLVAAHVLALESLKAKDARHYNLGLGRGFSVRQAIEAAREATGIPIPVKLGPRREGDPAILFADASRIARELGWTPRWADLPAMIETAWRWFRDHPRGYTDDP